MRVSDGDLKIIINKKQKRDKMIELGGRRALSIMKQFGEKKKNLLVGETESIRELQV